MPACASEVGYFAKPTLLSPKSLATWTFSSPSLNQQLLWRRNGGGEGEWEGGGEKGEGAWGLRGNRENAEIFS